MESQRVCQGRASSRKEEWDRHYRKRSNVETAFSMVKTKFGDAVRSKTETGQTNEILLKMLCHNLCVLVGVMHRVGLAPTLGRNQGSASV